MSSTPIQILDLERPPFDTLLAQFKSCAEMFGAKYFPPVIDTSKECWVAKEIQGKLSYSDVSIYREIDDHFSAGVKTNNVVFPCLNNNKEYFEIATISAVPQEMYVEFASCLMELRPNALFNEFVTRGIVNHAVLKKYKNTGLLCYECVIKY